GRRLGDEVRGLDEQVRGLDNAVTVLSAGVAESSRALTRVLTGNVAKDGGQIIVDEAVPGVRLYTGGGEIRVSRARGDISATTGGGDVTLQSVAGDAEVQTGAGDVTVGVAQNGGDVEITSGSGGVTVVLPPGYSGSVDVETAYTQGRRATRIDSDFPLAISETREWSSREGTPRRYVRGRATLGSGRHRVHVRTVNGDVRLVRAGGRSGEISARAGGGDATCAGESCTLDVDGANGSGGRTVTVNQSNTFTHTATGRGGNEDVVYSGGSGGFVYATGNAEERIASMREMARNAPPAAAAAALGRFAFADPEPRVQREAVEALATIRHAAATEQLRRIARDHPSAAIRRRAAEMLR
ncbi:MAG TPA: HEAT repeat domain-containing protein, partial [Longimicrobiaceae bacterium]